MPEEPQTLASDRETTPLPDLTAYLERFAAVSGCSRHLPHMRACAYDAGQPCRCREMMEMLYGKQS